MELIALIIVALIAAAVGVLYLQARKSLHQLQLEQQTLKEQAGRQEAALLYLQRSLEDRREELDDKRLEIQQQQQRLDSINHEFQELLAENSRLSEQQKYLQQQLITEKDRLQQVQQDFTVQFENIAQQLLQRISGTFMEQNQLKLDDMLKPLSDKIESFRSSVQQSLVAETTQRTELKAALQRLLELNQTLSREANNLTNALKSDTKRQGNWGEMILERVLEASGLEKGIHYRTQDVRRDSEGQLKRPDMLITLPEGRQLIIDSKVSLKAYEQYCSATDDAEKQQALRMHLTSVKNHVNELSSKAYHALYNNTTDFVLLFIPIEPAYALATMQQEEDLYDYAFRRRIILVSVPSLLATLRIIDAMWRLDNQNKNAEEIVRQGSALYDKFTGFVEDLRAIGVQLNRSQEVYENAINKLSTGNGNLIGRVERMRKLGLDTKKDLPKEFTDRAETTDNTAVQELPPTAEW